MTGSCSWPVLVVNTASGTAERARALRAALPRAEVVECEPADVQRLEEAAARARVLVPRRQHPPGHGWRRTGPVSLRSVARTNAVAQQDVGAPDGPVR